MNKFIFILTLFILCIGFSCINCYPDNDLWARIIAGGFAVENLSLLKHDIFSYTPTHIWYDHEWGASVIFYIVLKYFGASGLIFLKGILTAIILFICYKTVELRKPNSTVSYNIVYFALMFFVLHNVLGPVIRCHLFTNLFFTLFLYILERSRQGGVKILILLPVIMLLWSNMHGGCLSGIGLIALYCLGEFLNKQSIKKYIIALCACLAVLFINPYGIDYVKFLFQAGLMDRSYITEWNSPFHQHYLKGFIGYKIYLLLMILTQLLYILKNKINYSKLDKTKIIIMIATAYLSITHIRHIPFFILTAGIFLYDEFYSLLNSLYVKTANSENTKNLTLIKNIIIYFFLLIISVPPLISKKEIRITESAFPRFAVEFIKINNIKGNLFINFDWGSYAAYKLYPNNLIVMDGRYEEVYNPSLLMELKDFHLLKNDWYKIIRDYKTDVMILEKKYPVYNKILEHKDWKLIFENNISGVFVPANSVKSEYILPPIEDEYYNKTLFNTDIILKKRNFK